MTQAAQHSKRWGIEDICKYHTEFCAGDNSTRQYDSEAECLAYMRALPQYTEACGTQRPLSGNSVAWYVLSCASETSFLNILLAYCRDDRLY